jgi:hypothetical protein
LHIGGHLVDTTWSQATLGATMPTSSTYSGAVLDALSQGRGRECCHPFIPDSIEEGDAMSFCLEAWGGQWRRQDSLKSQVEGAVLTNIRINFTVHGHYVSRPVTIRRGW